MPDYTSIIKRSIEIIKKNKWLLVYGLLLAGGGGTSVGRNNIVSSFNKSRNLPKDIPQNLPEKTSQVLGTFTSPLKTWFLNVEPSKWILIILGLLVVIVFSIIVGIILRNWAKGALISGVAMAQKDQKVDLKNTSPQGLSSLKNLIIYSLTVTGIVFGIFIILPSFWLIIYFLVRNLIALKTVWVVLGVISGLLIILLVNIMIPIVGIYAERLIVLNSYKPLDAWKMGLSIGRKNLVATLVMGLINSIIGLAVSFVLIIVLLIILGIPGFVFVSSLMKGQITAINIIGIGILLIIFFLTTSIVRGVLAVFNYSNWNQMFDYFISQVEGEVSL